MNKRHSQETTGYEFIYAVLEMNLSFQERHPLEQNLAFKGTQRKLEWGGRYCLLTSTPPLVVPNNWQQENIAIRSRQERSTVGFCERSLQNFCLPLASSQKP